MLCSVWSVRGDWSEGPSGYGMPVSPSLCRDLEGIGGEAEIAECEQRQAQGIRKHWEYRGYLIAIVIGPPLALFALGWLRATHGYRTNLPVREDWIRAAYCRVRARLRALVDGRRFPALRRQHHHADRLHHMM